MMLPASAPAISGHSPAGAQAANYTFTGSPGATTLVAPGYMSATAAQITTTGNGAGGLGTWGAVDIKIPAGLTVRQVKWLSTEYQFTLGSCWGGSPRFEVWIPDAASPSGHVKIFLFVGPLPSWVGCPLDTWVNTGNLANLTSTGQDAEDDQLSGVPGYVTWSRW